MFTASFYNLKGGVGKTASCVNFAYLAAQDGYRTLIWDTDPQGASSFYYNTVPEGKLHARKLLDHELPISGAIRATEYNGLDIIPANLSTRKLETALEAGSSKKQLRHLIRELEDDYDFLFLDCPPGLSALSENVFYASDAVLMPVIPTPLSLRSYETVKEFFIEKDLDEGKLMCFFSMADLRRKLHQEAVHEMVREQRFFEHYIPQLSVIEKMGAHRAPVPVFAPADYATQCYKALWNEIKEGVLE